jgi:DNA-binding CsgD family transcriptional regulator/tetratricopeptide (TPR) repeat protein
MGLIARDGVVARIVGALHAGRSVAVTGPVGSGVSSVVRRAVAAAAPDPRGIVIDADDLATLFGASSIDLLSSVERSGASLIAIDDVHRLDDRGAASVRFVVDNGTVPVLLGGHPARTPGADALDRLADRGSVERIRLDGLDPDAAHALCLELDPGVRRTVALDIRRRAAGRAGLIHDLVVDPDATTRRLARSLDEHPDDVEVLARVSIGGPPDLIDPDALDRLVASGHVEVDPSAGLVRPSAPCLGAAALSQLVPVMRAALAQDALDHAAAIGRSVTPLERVSWMRAAGREPSSEDVCAAAIEARRHGRLWDAAQVLASIGADDLDADARMLRGEIAQESGDIELALDTYRSLAGDDRVAPTLRARCAVEWANVLFWDADRTDEALAVSEVLVGVTEGSSAAPVFTGLLASLQVFSGRPRDAVATLRRLDLDRPDAHAIALLAAASADAVGGACHRATELAERAVIAHRRDLGEETGVAGIELWINGVVLALGEAGRLDDAVAEAVAIDEGPIERDSRAGWTNLARARALLLTGDLARAAAAAAASVEAFSASGRRATIRWALAARALAAAEMGDVGVATAAAARLHALGPAAATFLDADVERALAFAEAADGKMSAARDRLRSAAQHAEGVGAHALAAMAWHDLARLGGVRAAAGPLRRGATRVDSAWTEWRVIHVEALLSDDAVGLERAAHGFASIGAKLHALEAACQALGVARLHTDHDAVARLVGLVAERRAACPDARTPASRSSASAELTPRERDVAELAAAGHANRVIAERLFVSQRTVENLLQRVYGKLGLAGRSQLADALRT